MSWVQSHLLLYADEVGGADGWKKVGRPVSPGAVDVERFHHCYHLFYSQSQHSSLDLL
ncbi:hypothetical protein [Micromonospora sp. NPDC093277]|uniref:hypothetical protein n=1 Tax=Micromonospora sp. NPDC093277 TaxID=3364291 RepID=UPI0038157A7F